MQSTKIKIGQNFIVFESRTFESESESSIAESESRVTHLWSSVG